MCSTCGCGSDAEDTQVWRVMAHPSEHRNILSADHHHHHHQPVAVSEFTPLTTPQEHTQVHKTIVDLEADIMQRNDLVAAHNQGFLAAKGVLALNLMSSPGSGKTTLLEKTLAHLKKDFHLMVIEGDQQTDQDARRIAATGVPVVQINTGKGCHLDAEMVKKALPQLGTIERGILFIENVGNLVCPSMFSLGEDVRVVIISVTEGEDKPIKYPDMFRSADVCIFNKIDLLPYLNFDLNQAKTYARHVNPRMEILELSATSGQGLESWCAWVIDKLVNKWTPEPVTV